MLTGATMIFDPNMNCVPLTKPFVSLGNASGSARHIGMPVSNVSRAVVYTYGSNRYRNFITLRQWSCTNRSNSYGAVGLLSTPWARNTGQNEPNWNQRMYN